MTAKDIPFDLQAFLNTDARDDSRNRMLLNWLSDDDKRAKLFCQLNRGFEGHTDFPSRDSAPRECDGAGIDKPRKKPVPGHETMTLVTGRDQIDKILRNAVAGKRYSNRVYAELGGGGFMLALDPAAPVAAGVDAHAAQRKAFCDSFPAEADTLQEIAFAACEAADVMSFRAPDFDLAAYAEQSALRFCQLLMGYAQKDFTLLETSLRAAYKGLVYQVFERHFITDPLVIPEAKRAMGLLLARTSTLIDAYAACDDDELKGCDDPARPDGFTVVLEKLGQIESILNGEQRAIVATGAAIGTVGNVQAAVCIVVKALFADDDLWRQARDLALDRRESRGHRTRCYDAWRQLLSAPLRANPPIPYLPRLEVDKDDNKVREVLLALGGGAQGFRGEPGDDDPLVWGLPGSASHNCAGKALAWPLIIECVRHVLSLPGLEEGRKAENAEIAGLEKRHGFACERYPLTHRRDKLRAQTSLNVAMRIKAPIKDNVDKIRAVIRAGAPRIECLLREARHVHFAWFEIIESNSVLVLHTVYDGPFGAYLQHFALRAGDLFDLLFELIEDPPPMPVHKFPYEFVAHLLRYNRAPAAGYFFSAYPRLEVAQIVRNFGREP